MKIDTITLENEGHQIKLKRCGDGAIILYSEDRNGDEGAVVPKEGIQRLIEALRSVQKLNDQDEGIKNEETN